MLAVAVLAAGTTEAQVSEMPQIAAKLRGMGTELSRDLVSGTMEMYGPLHGQTSLDGLTVLRDQTYGDHERHKLDVFAPESADGTAPIIVFVHGGGFVRGDKSAPYIAGIGPYFAKRGIVGIVMNYRLAPENAWPSGAEDIGMVLDWIAANSGVHGGDASRVVLIGNSAGAMHVADYTFREALQHDGDGLIGAILISPPTVDLTGRPIDPERDALYYGLEGDRADQSVVNHLDGRKVPVMIAYAEYEPQVIIEQTRVMIEALADRDGRMPLVVAAPGHNHISIAVHIGTADETLGSDLVEFVAAVAQGD